MWYAIVAILILIADQGLKYWVTLNIPLDTGHVTLIPGVLELTNIHNNGAAFSILQHAPHWIFFAGPMPAAPNRRSHWTTFRCPRNWWCKSKPTGLRS